MKCVLCGGKVEPVIDLGYHPCADTFVSSLPASETRYPLVVNLCQCGHAQLSHVVPAHIRYRATDYSYDSSNSKVSIGHFRNLAQEVSERLNLSPTDLVCDIGSNIGTLLEGFRCRIVGIEPSKNITELARARGIPTICDFFGMESAKEVLTFGRPKVITATNVLNHSEDIAGFFDAVDYLLDDGYLVVEVPYLSEMVRQTAFDTIYLEHVNYFSVTPLARFLQTRGFGIERFEVNDYMCGTLRLYIRRGVKSQMVDERHLLVKKTYEDFMGRVRTMKFRLNKELHDIKASGGKIIGIGAATKGNTLLNYCGIDSDVLEYVTDASALKVGKFTPGSHIHIVSDESIGPDITHGLILPWNIAGHLTKKLSHLGLKFIIPMLESHEAGNQSLGQPGDDQGSVCVQSEGSLLDHHLH